MPQVGCVFYLFKSFILKFPLVVIVNSDAFAFAFISKECFIDEANHNWNWQFFSLQPQIKTNTTQEIIVMINAHLFFFIIISINLIHIYEIRPFDSLLHLFHLNVVFSFDYHFKMILTNLDFLKFVLEIDNVFIFTSFFIVFQFFNNTQKS